MRASGFGTRVPDAKPRRRAAVLPRGLGPFAPSSELATEHLPPAKEGSINADVLESVQIAGERIFRAMDANKDGRLTLEEIQAFMQGARRSVSRQ